MKGAYTVSSGYEEAHDAMVPDIALGSVGKSVRLGKYSFPSMDDYVTYFLQKGKINSPDAIWQDDELIATIQRHWHLRGQNGCGFAQTVADRSKESGWKCVVFNHPIDELHVSVMRTSIQNVICSAEDAESTQLLSLLFPQIATIEELVALAQLLKSLERFNSVETKVGDFTAVGLQFILTSGIPAWCVGFGPFLHLPNTRQSPIAEVVVRPKTKPEKMFHRLNQDRRESHLADIPLWFDDIVAEQIYQSTLARVRVILPGEPNKFSSAKTTFTIPSVLWEEN
jgi:hypothetical protein